MSVSLSWKLYPELRVREFTSTGKRYNGHRLWSKGFPGNSAGKESTCNVGDPSSVPGSGRSPGERKDYPPQYSESDMTEQLSFTYSCVLNTFLTYGIFNQRWVCQKVTPL